MDWAETHMAFAHWNLVWPAGTEQVKQIFDEMWRLMRNMTLHYLRPDGKRMGAVATENARRWGQLYAALAEKVCSNLHHFHS